MTDLKSLYLPALLGLAPIPALAQSAAPITPRQLIVTTSFLPQIDLGIGVSTLGAGLTASIHNPQGLFGLSLQGNLFHFGLNLVQDGAKTKAQATLQNESLVLDLYPWRGHFHISAGVIFNQNNASFTTSPQLTGTLLSFITETHYAGPVGNVKGPISFNPIAPYLGVGYNWDFAHNLSIAANFGAMYQGNGRIILTTTGLLASNSQIRGQVETQTYHATEFLNKMSFYPIISLAAVYRF